MTTTIIGVYDNVTTARQALDALRNSSLDLDDVSILSRTGTDADSTEDVSAAEGATVGAVWGGLVGLAALLIPGVGPFVAGGALFAALTGAATGAVVGGLTAALIDTTGISEDEAREYEAMVREGRTLIAVKADDEDVPEVRRIMGDTGAESIRDDQTDITTSPDAPLHVTTYDQAGNRIERSGRALERGAAPAGTTLGDQNVLSAPNTMQQGPNLVGAVGTPPAAAGPGTPLTPDAPVSPRPGQPDVNIPNPDDTAERRM